MSTLGDVKPFSYYSSLGGENSLVPTVDKYHFIIVTKSPENTGRLIDPPCHPLPLVQFPVATSGPPCLLTLYSAVQCVEASYRGIGGPLCCTEPNRACHLLWEPCNAVAGLELPLQGHEELMGCGWSRRPMNGSAMVGRWQVGNGTVPFVRPMVYQMVSSSPVVNWHFLGKRLGR